jgi:hypothetical protein
LRTSRAGGWQGLRGDCVRADALRVRKKTSAHRINAGGDVGYEATIRNEAPAPFVNVPALICAVGCFLRTWRASVRPHNSLKRTPPPALPVRKGQPRNTAAMTHDQISSTIERQTVAQKHPKDRAPHAPGMEREITRRAKRRSGPTGRPPSQSLRKHPTAYIPDQPPNPCARQRWTCALQGLE